MIHIISKGCDYCETHLKRGIDLKSDIENIRQKFFELKIIGNKELSEEQNQSSDDSAEEVDEKEELDFDLFIPECIRREYGLEPLEQKPSTSVAQPSEDSSKQLNESENETKSRLQCRARLPSGRLCPRRDRIKCPFHGPIVGRDLDGVPINEEDRKREEELKAKAPPDWQNPQLLRELKASIGIDLTLNKRKRRKKYSELQDIKESENNCRKRLERIVFKKCVRERVERDLDEIQSKNQTHFGDQWNY